MCGALVSSDYTCGLHIKQALVVASRCIPITHSYKQMSEERTSPSNHTHKSVSKFENRGLAKTRTYTRQDNTGNQNNSLKENMDPIKKQG
jgi:hypothetical protein